MSIYQKSEGGFATLALLTLGANLNNPLIAVISSPSLAFPLTNYAL